MELWQYLMALTIIGITNCIIQYGLTRRTKIKEEYRFRRFEKSIDMDNSKIEAIGNYEKNTKEGFNFPKPWKSNKNDN